VRSSASFFLLPPSLNHPPSSGNTIVRARRWGSRRRREVLTRRHTGFGGECDWLSLRGGGRRGRRTTAEERERWRQKKERGNVDTHT
jgi:hypothetical protein